MNFKKLFVNFCLSIIAFSLFLYFFLKPTFGPQFEIIDSTKDSKSSTKVTNEAKETPSPNAKEVSTTPKVTPTENKEVK